MSKNLFFSFIRNLDSYETISSRLDKKIKKGASLHYSCKNSYSRPIPYIGVDKAREIIRQMDDSLTYTNFVPQNCNRTFKQHFIMLREKLRVWHFYLMQKDLKPFDTPENIIKRNLLEGSDYADYLKDLTAYSIRKTVGIDYFTTEESIIFDDINQIFPHQDLINFIRPKDYKDILDYAFEKPKISSNLSQLKEKMKSNIKKGENLRKLDFFDYLKDLSEKGSFEKGLSCFQERIVYSPNYEMPTNLTFRITSIHKTSSESRVIAIAEPSCKLNISYARDMYKTLLNAKYDFYAKNRWSFEKKLHQKKDCIHLLFDQKKCGWTFPMELLTLFFEVLSEEYPEVEHFSWLQKIFYYGEIYYIIDGINKKPLRGFTLGMFDDAVSFIMACIFEVFLESQNLNEGFYEPKIDGLFYGDDSDIIFTNLSPIQAKVYGNRWIYCMDSFGIYVNLKKSFYSDSGIFCEIYGNNYNAQMLKHVYYCIRGLDILNAHNTAHAKNLFNGYFRTIKTYIEYLSTEDKKIVQELLDYITDIVVSSFPYEFVENEFHFPYEVGGWIQHLEEGKNLLLMDYLNKDFGESFSRLYGLEQPSLYNYIRKEHKDFFIKALSESEFWLEKRYQLFLDSGNDILLDKYVACLKKESFQAKAWWEYQDKRHKVFFNEKSEPFLQRFWMVPFTKMKLSEECFSKIQHDCRYEYFTRFKPKEFMLVNPKTYIEPKRCQDLIRNINELKGPYYDVEYFKNIRIQDIYSQLDIDLAKNKYIIPTKWWRICKSWNIPIEKFFQELDSQGFNPFEYEPKFYKMKDKEFELEKIFDIKEEFITWVQECSYFVTFTREEAYNLTSDIFSYNYKSILKEKLKLDSIDQYEELCQRIKDMYVEEEIEDLDYGEDLKALEEEIEKIKASKNVIGRIGDYNILEYKASNQVLVSAYDPDLHGGYDDSEPESEEEKIELYPGYFVYKTEWENAGENEPDVLQHGSSLLSNIKEEKSDEDFEDFDPG
jgi:hypothetical protein